MEEEFHESEVIFSDHDHDSHHDQHQHVHNYKEMFVTVQANTSQVVQSRNNSINHKSKSRRKKKQTKNSGPINIPENVFHYADPDLFVDDVDDDEDDDGEFVPPHVILGRRIAGKVAFSVCTGNGRTLKGRDLSEVRNSILRMTGFLET